MQNFRASEILKTARGLGPSAICWSAEQIQDDDASANTNTLYKEELRGISPVRASQFLAGRRAAHAALEKLDKNLKLGILNRLASGAPKWPEGVTGSITHNREVALAAVAKVSAVPALGLDLQEWLSAGREQRLLNRISSGEELDLLENLAGEKNHCGSWLFSAKEAGFKLLSTLDPRAVRTITDLKLTSVQTGPIRTATLERTSPGGLPARLILKSVQMGSSHLTLALLT